MILFFHPEFPAALLKAELTELLEQKPNVRLVRNAVHNLSIVDPEEGYIGFIDLTKGTYTLFED